MLDMLNPFGFIADLYKAGKLQRWYKLLAGCLVAAFMGFWGGFGLVGGIVLANSHNPWLALVTALFAGCVLMAGSVALTVHKQGMWQELGIALPKELENEIETTDVGK